MNWLERVETLLIVALSGFMFWPLNVSSICLILLVVLTVLRKWKQTLPPIKYWWVILPAILSVLSWIIHGFPSDGGRELQLWPSLIAALIVFYKNPQSRVFLRGFQWLSVLQAVLMTFYLAFHPPFSSGFFSYELREAVAAFFGTHPTYLSAAWFFAAILLAQASHSRDWVRWAAILLLVICGGLAGGKMPMLAFVAVIAIWLWQRFHSKKSRAIALLGLLALSVTAICLNPGMQQRFAELTSLKTEFKEGDMLSSSDLRIGIWDCGIRLTAEHPFVGVGTGNTRSSLEACFADFEQVEFFDGEYNTHNQFLHFGLLGGFTGIFLFTGFMLAFIVIAIRQKKQILLYSTVYFTLLFLTENYLGRQLGMMLFSFFVLISYVGLDKPQGFVRQSGST